MVSTVVALIGSSSDISLLLRPSATNCRISPSRERVKDVDGLGESHCVERSKGQSEAVASN